MKGACDHILKICAFMYLEGVVVPLTDELRIDAEIALTSLASRGERVLGLCERFFDTSGLCVYVM